MLRPLVGFEDISFGRDRIVKASMKHDQFVVKSQEVAVKF